MTLTIHSPQSVCTQGSTESHVQEIKVDPDYPFAEHCAKWNVKASSLNARLCREGIFISRLKQESRDRLAEESFRQAQRRGGLRFRATRKRGDVRLEEH